MSGSSGLYGSLGTQWMFTCPVVMQCGVPFFLNPFQSQRGGKYSCRRCFRATLGSLCPGNPPCNGSRGRWTSWAGWCNLPGVVWLPHHHWVSPLSTGHAQFVARSCVMKIHFALLQNTRPALTARANPSAIPVSWLWGEQDTKGLFAEGCEGVFSSSVKCAVWEASPDPPCCSAGWMGSSVPVSSCHPGGFALAACTEPSRGTTGRDWPQQGGLDWGCEVPHFGSSAVSDGDRNCPLSCAGAATDPGPKGLQPRLFSHFKREKQWNDKRKFLTLFTGFFPPSLFVWDYAEYNLSPSALFWSWDGCQCPAHLSLQLPLSSHLFEVRWAFGGTF